MNMAFLWERARPFLRELLTISALSLVGSLATLALPWLAANFLAGVLGEGAIDLEWTLAMLAIALVSMTAITVAVAIMSELAAGKILAGLRAEAYQRIQRLPISFHDRSTSGDLLALMTYEVNNLSSFLTATLANVPSLLMTATGAVILLFLLDPAMALVIPIIVPIFYIVVKWTGRRVRMLARQARRAEARLMSLADSDLEILSAIKAFATEEHHVRNYRGAIETSRRLSLRRTRIAAFVGPVITLVAAIAAIAILLVGSAQVESGERSAGELFAFLLYAALLTRPVGGLASTYGSFQMARGTLSRLEAVFAKPVEDGYQQPGRIDRARGAINFENVSFAYPGRPPVLEQVSLQVFAGEIVALTGQNGIGKSTLINLLLRFYDPDSGQITLDGQDINGLQVQDLRSQFGYVPQRALLFNGSIRDNITFGASHVDPARLESAARLAQAWDFIQHLPRGLDTEIGDNGIRLSGGQRQRIALSRALFRDPPVYIFDEATSMYDLDGESAFVEACLQSLKGRTVIIITHRPASLALADRIIHADHAGFRVQQNGQRVVR